jgi:hypothetical protein
MNTEESGNGGNRIVRGMMASGESVTARTLADL